MANFLSLIFLLLFSFSSHATTGTYTPSNVKIVLGAAYSGKTFFYSDMQLACESANRFRANALSQLYLQTTNCVLNLPTGSQSYINSAYRFGVSTSPSASSNNDIGEVFSYCNGADTKSNANPRPEGVCSANNACLDGQIVSTGTFVIPPFKAPNPIGCLNSCEALFVGTAPYTYCPSLGGLCSNIKDGKYISTGKSCNTTTTTETAATSPSLYAASTPESKCLESGQAYGTVNGVVTCVPKSTVGAVTATLPPLVVSSSQTGVNGTTNTTTVSVINNDNTITTTTTTTGADGTPVTKTDTKPQLSFCAENPTSTICKEPEKGIFSGSCSSSFTCSGDAIQCAISKDQHLRHCELFDKSTSMTTQGKALVDGTATDNNPANLEKRDVINVGGMISEGSNIGGGTFTDKVIPLAGGGLTLPFAKLNFIMQILGGFILAAAYLNAARIVGVR